MRKTGVGIAAMALAALAALTASGMGSVQVAEGTNATVPSAQDGQTRRTNNSVAIEKAANAFRGLGFGVGSRGKDRRRGPGWTQAHVQRIARKKRNQHRNRLAHRG